MCVWWLLYIQELKSVTLKCCELDMIARTPR